MAEITASLVKELRGQTGAGMMDCKRALIEVDGDKLEHLYLECESISKVMQRFSCGEILLADTHSEKESLWKIRRSIGEAVKVNSIYKEEDTVVPRAELPSLLNGVKNEQSARWNIVNFIMYSSSILCFVCFWYGRILR